MLNEANYDWCSYCVRSLVDHSPAAAGLVEMADGYWTTSGNIKLQNIYFTWKLEVMDAHRQIPTMADNTVALHSEAVTVSGTSTFFYLHWSWKHNCLDTDTSYIKHLCPTAKLHWNKHFLVGQSNIFLSLSEGWEPHIQWSISHFIFYGWLKPLSSLTNNSLQ